MPRSPIRPSLSKSPAESALAAFALAALAAACTKASDDKRPAKPIEQTPFEAGHATLTAASPAGDVLTVLLRFDHLKAFALDDEVDALMAILPDHRRVFGGSGKAGITGSFDAVYVSTSDPAVLTATTLAARALKPETMQTMLAYPGAGVTWRKSPLGPLGEIVSTERFRWYDTRVYLMPRDPWIVLVKPYLLGAERTAKNPVQPAWLKAVPDLARLGAPDKRPGKLLAAATATNLPRTAILPAVGAVTMPTRMIAAATAHKDVVTFTGDMSFTDERHASAATDTLATLRKRFERFRPVRDMKVRRDGVTLLWSTSASTAETAVLTELAANLIRPIFPAGSSLAPPPVSPKQY